MTCKCPDKIKAKLTLGYTHWIGCSLYWLDLPCYGDGCKNRVLRESIYPTPPFDDDGRAQVLCSTCERK